MYALSPGASGSAQCVCRRPPGPICLYSCHSSLGGHEEHGGSRETRRREETRGRGGRGGCQVWAGWVGGGGGIRNRGPTTHSRAPSPAARVLHPGPASPREMGAVRSPEETPLMTALEADLQSQCGPEQSASQDHRQPVEETTGAGPAPPTHRAA